MCKKLSPDRSDSVPAQRFNKKIIFTHKDIRSYTDKGLEYFNQNDLKQAFACFDKALELKEDDTTAYYYRGLIYKLMGYFPKALADFLKALELDRSAPEIYYNCAQIYGELQDNDLYIQYLIAAARHGHTESMELLKKSGYDENFIPVG
jgi:tetratricopeptide (TPR) repeat protein